MNELLYSEWVVLKALQDKTMTLQELHFQTGLDRGLLSSVITHLVKLNYAHASRGIFRARIKVGENPRYNIWGESMITMINETYRASLKDSVLTSA
ncbi:MAG: hypothetical protein CME71_12035 [Halobacteriovorax sp.]|nr:hypothetical protein [Halobacteriovorax sp.]